MYLASPPTEPAVAGVAVGLCEQSGLPGQGSREQGKEAGCCGARGLLPEHPGPVPACLKEKRDLPPRNSRNETGRTEQKSRWSYLEKDATRIDKRRSAERRAWKETQGNVTRAVSVWEE